MTDSHNALVNTAANLATSPNPTDTLRAQLAALLPAAFSEGKLDIAALQRALGEEAITGNGERYTLDWAGKANAYKVLQTPSSATLRPERGQSVDFDAASTCLLKAKTWKCSKCCKKRILAR